MFCLNGSVVVFKWFVLKSSQHDSLHGRLSDTSWLNKVYTHPGWFSWSSWKSCWETDRSSEAFWTSFVCQTAQIHQLHRCGFIGVFMIISVSKPKMSNYLQTKSSDKKTELFINVYDPMKDDSNQTSWSVSEPGRLWTWQPVPVRPLTYVPLKADLSAPQDLREVDSCCWSV